MSLVLDASIALDWCFDSERSAAAEQVLKSVLSNRAIVPAIWTAEVANGLLSGHRRGRLTAAEMVQATQMLSELPIEIVGQHGIEGIHALVQLGREFSLTAYDSAYLALAMQHGFPLATADTALAAAARRAGIGLAIPPAKLSHQA